MYRWGHALYRSSGIRPNEERHPHIIKDFISSLKKNIRNKIANRWAEMRNPPNTVERAFKLANDVEKQLQVADSFKLDCPTYPSRELNEMSAEDSSGDENEVNEIARNKRWVSNPGSYNCKQSNMHNNGRNSNYRFQQRPHETKQPKQWSQKQKDSKITLKQESDHYVPAQFSNDFFKKFDIAMKIRRDELKEQQTNNRQVNEITENNFMQAFGVTESQMDKAAEMLVRSKSAENSGNSLA